MYFVTVEADQLGVVAGAHSPTSAIKQDTGFLIAYTAAAHRRLATHIGM